MFHPLTLRADVEGWHLFATRSVDSGFTRFADKVRQRDNHTCRFCGFQSHQYMHVVNLDHNYRNNMMSNLATSCPFCTQCNFIHMIGKMESGGGTIIYAPELSQNDINGLCHVTFCAITNATSYLSDAQNIYNNIRLRSRTVEEKLGEGLSDPAMLGQMLIDTPFENKEQISYSLLAHLRVLPSRSKFSKEVEAWARAALQEMSA